jgi:hypothetical protein
MKLVDSVAAESHHLAFPLCEATILFYVYFGNIVQLNHSASISVTSGRKKTIHVPSIALRV